MKIRVNMDITFPSTEDAIGSVIAAGDYEVGEGVTQQQADIMLKEPKWAVKLAALAKKPEKKGKDA